MSIVHFLKKSLNKINSSIQSLNKLDINELFNKVKQIIGNQSFFRKLGKSYRSREKTVICKTSLICKILQSSAE
jgi:hypothetical protein